MTPPTPVLLVCAVLLCGLEETVLSQRLHCAGNLCSELFQKPGDFSSAQKGCKEAKGQLFSSKQAEKRLTSLIKGLDGNYWLELRDTGRKTEEAAAGLQYCSSISASTGGNPVPQWKLCHDKLDGFLCQYTVEDPCGRLKVGGGARVRYTTHMGVEMSDSETFPQGTIAVAEKVGGKYPESKHVCFSGYWMRSPWKCEVMSGGCEHGCNSTTDSCLCPTGQTLQPNNFTCTKEPSAHCADECQQCGDGYMLAPDGTSCVDVDECQEEDVCTDVGEECLNTPGSFECKCKDGYEDENGTCVDVSICEKCEHMLCDKLNGVYACSCRKGFRVSPRDPTKCDQHCSERVCLAKCVQNSEVNRTDLLQCFCPEGYIRDVMNNEAYCIDIDECEMERPCMHKCENTLGGYRCLCHEGFQLQKEDCVPIKAEEDEEEKEEEEEEMEYGSSSAAPFPTPASVYPDLVPHYIKTGSVLGITVFMVACVALLFFVARGIAKRCGKFKLPTFKHPDIDIFYLQQVTTETYKRLSFDKQSKSDLQRL